MCCPRPSSASFLALESLYVGIESIEAPAPELLESTDPVVDRLEPAGVELVEALLPRLAHGHEPDLAQYAQVLGDAGLGDAECPRQLVHRALPPLEQCEDAPALRLGDRVERVRRGRGSCHEEKYMPISEYCKAGLRAAFRAHVEGLRADNAHGHASLMRGVDARQSKARRGCAILQHG